MKNEVARFMLKEIDDKLRYRRKDAFLLRRLESIRPTIEAGADLTGSEEAWLDVTWQRMTDPARLKWGNAVRPR